MPDPKLAEDEEKYKQLKKPDPTDISLFRAGMKSIAIGIVFILFGQWATFGTDMYWPIGVVITFMGAAFPPVYLWIMLRVARETEQPAPPNRIPN
jgi:hypothetical protein